VQKECESILAVSIFAILKFLRGDLMSDGKCQKAQNNESKTGIAGALTVAATFARLTSEPEFTQKLPALISN